MDRNKHHVIAYCQQMGYSLLMPSKTDRTIMVYEDGKAFNRCLAEGTKWADIASQLGKMRSAA
jgi:hypothetical protein